MDTTSNGTSLASGIPATRVTGDTWKVNPIENPATAPWTFDISSSDVTKLLQGFQPGDMDDRWMSRADGPDAQGKFVVHLYRSWTGDEYYQIKATTEASEGRKARITEFVWNAPGGPDEFTEEESKSMATRVCRAILGCEFEQAPESAA